MEDLNYSALQDFASKFSTKENHLLEEIAHYTYSQQAQPHMMSGHLQGQVLKMISHMVQPKRVLEIGTFTGYSALCLAEGLTEDGILHTIEKNAETGAVAHNFFLKSPLWSKIKMHIGHALDIIPTIEEEWDLLFIDADKCAYIDYFKMVMPRIKKNGFIIADNIFFHGKALQPDADNKSAKCIIEFNNFIYQNNEVEKLVLTVRDGLYILRKI